ncbi:MAG: hypothetical protein CM1200mP15_05820 [Dehalococcoidia bacterium]|nr:MAG: hypothetical protein CM1200mP15_05820 [Dehalococcoidia bacterium]
MYSDSGRLAYQYYIAMREFWGKKKRGLKETGLLLLMNGEENIDHIWIK